MISLAVILVLGFQPETFTAMITGPETSLAKLSDAARKCGYEDAAIVAGPSGTHVVALEVPAVLVSGGSRFDCVMKWTFAHPELSFGFIGNAAR